LPFTDRNLIRGSFIDITERKKLEERLRQSQKMESVGRLAGGIAHDFNNLLTVITGYSELMLSQLEERSPLVKEVEEIKRAGERASSLTQQLLAFSRRQVLQPRVIDLNEVVSRVEKMLRRLIGEDVELRTVPGAGLWSVKADPGQIEQVLVNLVVNARDAMPGGGVLTIETGNVFLDEEYSLGHLPARSGHYVMLAVSDTGVGMDERTKSQVFEPFFTTKESGKGTGLGLSTVYGIVKQSGGYIWVYSEPGKGSTFKVYIPRTEEREDDPRKAVPPVEDLRGEKTVLIVEDEESILKLSSAVLGGYGYSVLAAPGGEDGLRIAGKHEGEISLLLTDVVMPGMGGRELYERILQQRPKIKVLYMSGYTDKAIVRRGVLDPGTSFLQKPFSPISLARKVKEVLETRA
jgi:nitrogen-specific signal transduction histidine kinase